MRKAEQKVFIAALLVLFAAAGAPLSQLFRVAEIAPTALQAKSNSNDAPKYRLVLASDFDPLAQAAKKSEKKDPASKSEDVRLLKILDEQWESSARTQVDSADVPVLPSLVHPIVAVENDAPQGTLAFVPLEFNPPNPPARGPPL